MPSLLTASTISSARSHTPSQGPTLSLHLASLACTVTQTDLMGRSCHLWPGHMASGGKGAIAVMHVDHQPTLPMPSRAWVPVYLSCSFSIHTFPGPFFCLASSMSLLFHALPPTSRATLPQPPSTCRHTGQFNSGRHCEGILST